MRGLSISWLIALLGCMVPVLLHAHEVRPAYLEMVQNSESEFEVTFKQPTRGDMRLPIEAALPANCSGIDAVRQLLEPGSVTSQWHVRCEGSIVGGQIGVSGLSRTMIDALVRVQFADGTDQTWLLKPSNASVEIGVADAAPQVLAYLQLGIEHLLFGLDHVLFVLGLMYFVKGFGALVRTVTAFTVAHSMTLGLSALNVVHVSSAPVEATIALSILFLAAEGMHPGERRSVVWRKPWVVAFGFGLLHGFGFAGALAQLGLPNDAVLLALFLFNVGVEIGQVGVIVCLFGLLWLYYRQPLQHVRAGVVPLGFMGVVAAFWSIQRIVPIVGLS